jgi:hypothetical protein
MSAEPTTLPVVVVDDEEDDRFLERFRRTEVPVESVREHLASFLAGMESALEAVPRALSAFRVDEVTLTLEVSATGKVSLVGTGAEVTGKGGLTILLRRQE